MKNSYRLLAVSLFFIGSLYSGTAQSATTLAIGSGTDNSSAAAKAGSSAGESMTYGMEQVTPYEFRGDLRQLRQLPVTGAPSRRPYRPLLRPPQAEKLPPPAAAPALPSPNISVNVPLAPMLGPLAPMPATIQNFAGMNFNDTCTGGQCGAGWPPDPNGDVGLNHYIQAVNDAYAIYNKTGTLLASFTENNLWSGSGSNPCNGNSQGDPVVLYDQMSDRWILTNLAFAVSGTTPISPFYQCIAVSKTSDPVAGGWWLYPVRMDTGAVGQPPVNTLNDYSKFGIWPDCLYMSANGFTFPAGTFTGLMYASFSRTDLELGNPLTSSNSSLGFLSTATDPFTMIPSNMLGTTPSAFPASGTPNYFVSESQTAFTFEVRKFTAGTNCGAGGTLSAATNVSQTSYTAPGQNIVPQPGTTTRLDSLGDRLMQKVQYRKVGSAESLWVVHSVRTSNASTVRPQWAQLDVTGGTIATTPVQQQIYAPDTTLYRWMGSIAADNQGNVALGYSTSNGTAPNYPSIAYSGRLATDPPGTLPQTETQIVAGSGSQTNTCGGAACNRWGDYSAMSVDPVDDCTFWYTNQYYSSAANGASGNWQTRIASFKFLGCTAPTAVNLISFTATSYGNGVQLRWKTGHEVSNLGFHIYRQEGDQLVRLTPEPVAGSALLAGARTALTAGRSYTWWDDSVFSAQYGEIAAAKYWLEDIDLNGKRTMHGPVTPVLSPEQFPEKARPELLHEIGARQAGKYQEFQRVQDLRKRLREETQRDYGLSALTSGQSRKVYERIDLRATSVKTEAPSDQDRAMQWVLASSPAVKISVKEEGWYRLGQPELIAAGLSGKVNPRYLQLFADGREQPIDVTDGKDGKFGPQDTIEFYGTGLDTPFTDTHVYWLVAGSTSGKRVQGFKGYGNRGQSGPPSFPFTIERKDRTIYFAALLNGEADNFFGPVVLTEPADEILTVRHPDPSPSADAVLEVALQGVTAAPHRVNVQFNDTGVGEVVFSGQEPGSARLLVPRSLLREGDNLVTLMSDGGEMDVSLVDSVQLTYLHTYTADDNSLKFTAQGRNQGSVGGFGSPDVRVVDITDANSLYEVTGDIKPQGAGYAVTFVAPGTGQRTLLAFTGDRIRKPVTIAPNQPSSWHQRQEGADIVIVSHRDFLAGLSTLKALREKQGWSVALIDVEDLYDEFNFGQKSPWAMKDFLGQARGVWKTPPRFVLFVGDSSFDPRNYLGLGDFDFVPTKLIDTKVMETASDDWFADFQGDGLPVMAMGRFPVRTADEAAAVVSKIVGYERSDKGSWTKQALLVADRNEGFNFENASEAIKARLPKDVVVSEIFRAELGDLTARGELLSSLNQGSLLVNYIGHGSVEVWDGNLLTSEDASTLTNGIRLPFVISMTCLNGLFNDVYTESLAEALLKAEQGGAVAVWASSGLTEPNGQAVMNEEVIRLLFNGASPTLGEATARAKAAVSDMDVRRTWILFGDPATRLRK